MRSGDLIGHVLEDFLTLFRGELSEHVGGVVGREFGDDFGDRLGVHVIYDIAADRLVEHDDHFRSRMRG